MSTPDAPDPSTSDNARGDLQRDKRKRNSSNDSLTSAGEAPSPDLGQHGTSAIASSQGDDASTEQSSPELGRGKRQKKTTQRAQGADNISKRSEKTQSTSSAKGKAKSGSRKPKRNIPPPSTSNLDGDGDSNPSSNAEIFYDGPMAMSAERLKSLSEIYDSPNKTGTKKNDRLKRTALAVILVASAFGYRSLLSNAANEGPWSMLEKCHIIEKKYGFDIFEALGKLWGMASEKALYSFSPWNICFLLPGEHSAFDLDCFILLPTEDVCREIFSWVRDEQGNTNKRNYRDTFPVWKRWTYRFYALKADLLKEGAKFVWTDLVKNDLSGEWEPKPGEAGSRLRDWRTCNDGESWDSVQSHLHPFYVVFRAGVALFRQNIQVDSNIDPEGPWFQTLLFIQRTFDIWRAEMSSLDGLMEDWEDRLRKAPRSMGGVGVPRDFQHFLQPVEGTDDDDLNQVVPEEDQMPEDDPFELVDEGQEIEMYGEIEVTEHIIVKQEEEDHLAVND